MRSHGPAGSGRSAAIPAFDGHPRLAALGVAGVAAFAAGLAAGPAAAGLAAIYTGGTVILLARHRVATRRSAAQAATLDAVADLAAELRAGAPPATAVSAARPILAATPVEAAAVLAAWQVSEACGAPFAEVLDRVEAQLRQMRRLRDSVAAHRAGTRATALLLAALPAGGIGLGYTIGADPLAVLLGTPLGAGCAALACALQLAGLGWTERLSRVDDA